MKLKIFLALLMWGITGCVSPRTSPIFSIPYDEQASRGLVRTMCNGQMEFNQGLVVCEEKAPTRAIFTVKVPPLPGRAIFSNGLVKNIADFNNYGEEGFFFWKKQKIKDSWVSLDLKELSDFGSWPVVISVAGLSSKVGVIQNSIIFYGRVCDDKSTPCSSLEVKYECVGHIKKTGPNKIGKCQRMSGSPQDLSVVIPEDAKRGMVYFSLPQAGVLETREFNNQKEVRYTVRQLPSGPSLMGIRVAYYKGGELIQKETRILFLGVDPKWTGTDKPQIIGENGKARILKPFQADLLEASLYDGMEPIKRWISHDEKITGVEWPKGSQKLCAFSYARESSDLEYVCISESGAEVDL